MTWSEANERCAALDPDNKATLTSVRSQEENDYIVSLLDGVIYWIGGTDETEEGVWRWVNSNITLSKSITCSPISWSFGCFVRLLCYSCSAKAWSKCIRSKGGCMDCTLAQNLHTGRGKNSRKCCVHMEGPLPQLPCRIQCLSLSSHLQVGGGRLPSGRRQRLFHKLGRGSA